VPDVSTLVFLTTLVVVAVALRGEDRRIDERLKRMAAEEETK
jgi:hypothetical protein